MIAPLRAQQDSGVMVCLDRSAAAFIQTAETVPLE